MAKTNGVEVAAFIRQGHQIVKKQVFQGYRKPEFALHDLEKWKRKAFSMRCQIGIFKGSELLDPNNLS